MQSELYSSPHGLSETPTKTKKNVLQSFLKKSEDNLEKHTLSKLLFSLDTSRTFDFVLGAIKAGIAISSADFANIIFGGIMVAINTSAATSHSREVGKTLKDTITGQTLNQETESSQKSKKDSFPNPKVSEVIWSLDSLRSLGVPFGTVTAILSLTSGNVYDAVLSGLMAINNSNIAFNQIKLLGKAIKNEKQHTPDTPDALSEENPNQLSKREKKMLKTCNLDPALVGEKIARGYVSKVYKYALPNSDKEWVVKLRSRLLRLQKIDVQKQEVSIELMQKYFGNFFPKTELRKNGKADIYCILMEYIHGEEVTRENIEKEGVREQIEEILEANRKLMKDYGTTVDFIGGKGFVAGIRSKPLSIANLLIEKKDDGKNKVWIVDNDLFQYQKRENQDNGKLESFEALVAHSGNMKYLKDYFNLDM